MLTERSIINFLVWTGGLILGPYLAVTSVELNFYPLAVFTGLCCVVLIFGYLRDRMSLVPLIGLSIAGKLNIIPVFHPAPSEFFPLVAIFYYIISYVALQRKKVLVGPLSFFIPILVIAAIILYHEHSFGVRALSANREGGRGAVFMLVAVVTYVCCVSMNSPSPRFISWVPVFTAIVAALSAIPYVVTTYLPGTAPFFYIFTDNVNTSAYTASVLVDTDIVRNQAQAGIGASVMAVLLAYFPIYTWWRPHRWWVAIVAAGCIGLVVMGGYRSGLAGFALTIFVAIWCYSSWRALFVLPVMALGALLVAQLQTNHVIHLSEASQRSLAFVPGNWDPAVLDSTDSSNDFRKKIEQIYLKEDAHKSPLLGNGLSYDTADFERYTYLARYNETTDGYYNIESFLTSKMFHTGWISLYDAVGLVGFAAYLVFVLSLIWKSGRMVFDRETDRSSPLFPVKVWMFSCLLPSTISYFTVFGDFKGLFPAYCYFAVLWVHLHRVEKFGYRSSVPVREVPFDPTRTQIPQSV